MKYADTLSSLCCKYPPIDKQQEDKLIDKMINGQSEEEKIEAKHLLLLHNLHYIKKQVNLFSKNSQFLEDLESSAIEGFIRSLNNFDPKYKTSVRTHSRLYILYHMIDCFILNISGDIIPIDVHKKTYTFKKQNPEATEKEILNFISTKFNLDEQSSMVVYSKIVDKNYNEFSCNGHLFHNERLRIDSVGSRMAKIELKKIANDLDSFANNNLTRPQRRAIKTVIIPFLIEGKVVTIKEAAKQLTTTYQSLNQLFNYMKINMVDSTKGRFYIRVIELVLEQVKTNKSTSNT